MQRGFFLKDQSFFVALVVELVDTQDLKSCDHCGRAGSSPARGTNIFKESFVSVIDSKDFFLHY